MYDNIVRFLKETDVEYYENYSLKNLSNIKIGGVAALSVCPDSVEKTVELLSFLSHTNVKFKVVGRMTNTMFRDGFFDGVVIQTSKLNRKSRAEDVYTAECGVRLSRLIWDAAKAGLGGAEELFMIPGCVGGSVFNNCGAHAKCIEDIFVRGDFYSISQGKIITLEKSEMFFSYRYSVLASRDLTLLRADFKFEKSDFEYVKNKISEYISIRRGSQPLDYPSLGSVYKRDNGVGAGYYIEKAGLKGYRIGDAEISKKHAGFILNVGNATSFDVDELIMHTKKSVYEKFGVDLKEEIEII